MSLPVPYTFHVKRHQAGATDPLGNPVDSWGDPESLPAHGIQPGAMTEPGEPGRDANRVEWSILAPAGTSVGARDKITLPGMTDEFDVIGHVKDFSMGPWDFPGAGVVIEVGKVEG